MAVATTGESQTSWELTLPFEVASVPKARRRLASELRERGVDRDSVEDAVLVLSELVGNAVRHARPLPAGDLRVSWTFLGGKVEVAVTDGGAPTRPRALNPPMSALGGRGLSIVGDLSSSWGVRPETEGPPAAADDDAATTVYAVVPLRQ